MKSYHVFVERTLDPSPSSIPHAARGIARRFGVPAEQIEQRLRAGRFRVKANVDEEKARLFANELEALGVVCSVEDSAKAMAAPRPQITTLHTPAPMPVPPVVVPAGVAQPETSALAAAGSGSGQQGLGALGSDGALRLTAIDGSTEAPQPPPAAFTPPDHTAPPASAQAPRSSAPAPIAPAPSPDASFDNLFMPPEMAQENEEISLQALTPAKPAPLPVAQLVQPAAAHNDMAPAAPAPLATASAPSGPSGVARARELMVTNARFRFAAGVALAVIVGFLPAHIISSLRESSSYSDIRSGLLEDYATAENTGNYDGLDQTRAAALERMKSRRFTIAVGGCLLWAGFGGGLGFVWFRKIDWARLAQKQRHPRARVLPTPPS